MDDIGVQTGQDSEVSPGDNEGLVKGLLIPFSFACKPDDGDVASGA